MKDVNKLNTIYIISKGRPQCSTAKVLKKLNYPSWFIVCGTNDETLSEYVDKWGKDRVIVFDWKKEIETTDTLDNFGFESMPSGATPVRNATIRISKERGESRHWQLDDDYTAFGKFDCQQNKYIAIKDGQELFNEMLAIANFGHKTGLPNVGFSLSSEVRPEKVYGFAPRVFNAHNMISDPEKAQFWRGRMNDDLINAIEVNRRGLREFSFRFLSVNMKPSQQESGGLTDIYREEGTVRKTAYAVLIAPNAVRLVIKFGRYHHRVNWQLLKPCILNERYRKA